MRMNQSQFKPPTIVNCHKYNIIALKIFELAKKNWIHYSNTEK